MDAPDHAGISETDPLLRTRAIDENTLTGPPPTNWHEFKHPKLRQFPGHGARIKWLKYLGCGSEGIVFKARFGDGDPVAVKVFWLTLRPRYQCPMGKFKYDTWPFEHESRNVALMEKIRWVMSNTGTNPNGSFKIREGPKTRYDALRNLYSFSDESRQSAQTSTRQGVTDAPPFPPLPKCFGWMRIQRDQVPHVRPHVEGLVNDDVDWHWATIYEFVPGRTQDLVVGQAHLDFFYAMGFSVQPYKPNNWHGGRLVDCNDISTAVSGAWHPTFVHDFEAQEYFWTLKHTLDGAMPHSIVRPPKHAGKKA
ncbi:hypothetical protein F4777DRAFT_579612 [Nemania sp. FL0916]|nr:hypothetical protein F4777DRAFT_579612 [Nemania sp. FL0916]